MKATTVIEIHANLSGHVPDGYGEQVQWVTRNNKLIPVFPVGTTFTGEHAVIAVKIGQAMPADEECKKACGLDPSQLASQQLEYEMTAKGVNSPRDRELYKSKVILGFEPGPDGKTLVPIKGPNWDQYQAAKAASENVGNV